MNLNERLRQRFSVVFGDAMERLFSEEMREIFLELDKASYPLPESMMKAYYREGRPKRQGSFREPSYFLVALRDTLDEIKNFENLTETQIRERINKHPFCQRRMTSTKTLRNWCLVRALRRRQPAIDFQTADAAGLRGLDDPEVLAIAAREGRILVSHDRQTMPQHFADFVMMQHSPGVFILSQSLPISHTVKELLIVWEASEAEEWIDTIQALPL